MTQKNNLILWTLLGVLVGILFALYVVVNLSAGHGKFIMPLDDVYIHFQYAKQMALGYPYQYNVGQPPTSGATSFLYPYVLAVGYRLGFTALQLGLWAMLVGAVALWASLIALVNALWYVTQKWSVTLSGTVMFGLVGTITWHYFSGMETGLVMCFSLWTWTTLLKGQYRAFIVANSLLALIRPELSLMAMLASLIMAVRLRHDRRLSQMIGLCIPIACVLVQPMVNWLITGTAVATGNQSKSILATVPADWVSIMMRVVQNLARIGLELVIGNGHEGWYLPLLGTLFALVGLVSLLRQSSTRWSAIFLCAWFVLIAGAVSTLDNAFWHYKRYQMPLVVFIVPLATIGLWMLLQQFRQLRLLIYGYVVFALVGAIGLSVQFLAFEHENVGYVYAQPYQMALWLQQNTPADSVVAVHDVGMMRYIGERNTLDIVGLTTPNASQYWRNGVGSVAEFLLQEQPDYIASYDKGHGYGLGMLAETPLMQHPLAEFIVNPWQSQTNVALAGQRQAIYQPDWSQLTALDALPIGYQALTATVVDVLNIANLQSETTHRYRWQSHYTNQYVTEVYALMDENGQVKVDGGRLINESETFELNGVTAKSDAILQIRTHPQNNGSIAIYVNDTWVANRSIIYRPGEWYDVMVLLPAELLTSTPIQIRVVPSILNGYYMPYRYTLWQVDTMPAMALDTPMVTYNEGQFGLTSWQISSDAHGISLQMNWQAAQQNLGDYRFFVHLYDDITQPPIAQSDIYAPPGNWLLGNFPLNVFLDTSQVPNGEYDLAIGFYDPYTNQRLVPTTTVMVRDERVFLQKVVIDGR